MKILYAAASPVPSRAANSVHVVKMAQALADNGHNVTLMAPKQAGASDDIFDFYGVGRSFTFLPVETKKNRLGTILYGLQVVRKARAMNADFIFTRCLPTALISGLLFVPFLYERHSDFWGSRTQEMMYRLLVRLPAYRGTIVVSNALKHYFTGTLKTPERHVYVAPDGSDPIDLDQPSPFEKTAGRKTVGYIGHLYKGRGIDLIADLASLRPDYDFHIVGGNDDDLAYWKSELGTIPNMIFHGYVPHAATKAYLVNFDAILAPYQKKVMVALGGNTEQWMSPLKIFESMSSGKPLICSDMPVLREALEDRINCLLCPPEDKDAWAAALDKLLLNPSYAKEIAQKALEDFLTKYTWKRRAANIIQSVFGGR